jgi:hypothetical protein
MLGREVATMTEAEWLAATDPVEMVVFLARPRGRPFFLPPQLSVRKQVLLFCAFCRQVWGYIRPAVLRDVVRVGERFADEQAPGEEWRSVRDSARDYCRRRQHRLLPRGAEEDQLSLVAEVMVCQCDELATRASDIHQVAVSCGYVLCASSIATSALDRDAAVRAEMVAQANLLRCGFGNPFRPVSLDPSWATSTVQMLAHGIYADRAFDRLPILADALQDAGCENDDILNHLRGPGPHVRGCWVVDLLLRKE